MHQRSGSKPYTPQYKTVLDYNYSLMTQNMQKFETTQTQLYYKMISSRSQAAMLVS